MIHTKFLIRRLAYVPWLLAFGLVLGWAGEAQAIDVTEVKVSPKTVREDAGPTPITVTIKNTKAKAGGETVQLSLVAPPVSGDEVPALNSRYRLEGSLIITVAADAETGTGTFTLIPINDKFRGAIDDYKDDGLEDGVHLDDLVLTVEARAMRTPPL